MHPHVGHHRVAEGATGLGDLVLVVREHEVDAAAVDVEHLAQMLPAHRRALDVPARPAASPRALPAGKLRRRGLPQHEVGGVLLVGRDLDARAGDHFVERAPGEFAVTRHRGHMEQHVPVRHIGVAGGDEALDDLDHLADVLGRPRLDVRRQHAQRRDVGVELRQRALGQVADRNAFLSRAGVDLVVHVGDVAHIPDMILPVTMAQEPVQHVEHDDGPRIADVGVVVDGGAADVHPHVLLVDRPELLLAAGQRVPELERHRARVPVTGLAGPALAFSGGEREKRPAAGAMPSR